jgi:hypothetical protein
LDAIASEIAGLALENQGRTVELGALSLPESLHGIVDSLSLYPTPTYQKDPLWQHVEAAIVEVVPDAVRKAINSKEHKLAIYRRHADQIYLLIYASCWPCVGQPDLVNSSTCGTITDELRQTTFVTSFDRVYYFDRQWGQVLSLHISKQA